MRTLFVVLFGALLLVGPTPDARGQSSEEIDENPEGEPYVAGELLVTYEPRTATEASEELPKELDGNVEEEIPRLDTQLLAFPEVKDEPSGEKREKVLARKKEELERDPAVESVDYNHIYELSAAPNDEHFGKQWSLRKIGVQRAWKGVRGDGVRIAVVDTGIDRDHPDLGGKVVAQTDVANDDGVAEDRFGHGTHVAGIAAAATGNGRGVAGTCPGCDLLIAKVDRAEDGIITAEALIGGIDWAVEEGAKVVNVSLGGPDVDAVQDAVDHAWKNGVVVIAAAGNRVGGGESANEPSYPAAYENTIAVSATKRSDEKAGYSKSGRWIDVAAPGGGTAKRSGGIFSTIPGGYGYRSGTSMATPHVAGLAGLLSAQGRSAPKIRDRIQATAVDLRPEGKDRFHGYGRIDAAAAVGVREQSSSRHSRNTAPRITKPRPRPGSKVQDRTPSLRATVRDGETDLRKSDISLYLDGRSVPSFEYNRAGNKLSYTPKRKLSRARHRVKIVAGDEQGRHKIRKWAFRVERDRKRAKPHRRRPGRRSPFSVIDENRPFDALLERRPFGPLRQRAAPRRQEARLGAPGLPF